MRILLLGNNTFSRTLAQELISEGHELIIVTKDANDPKLTDLDSQIITGCPSHPEALKEADADKADILLAITRNDEMNMIACQIGYSLFNIPLKIATISSHHYLIRHELFGDHNLPIDIFINPAELISQSIEHTLNYPGSTQAVYLDDHAVCLTVPVAPQSPLCQQTLATLWHSADTPTPLAINRNLVEQSLNTPIQANDFITFSSTPSQAKDWCQQCQPERHTINKVIISGGNDLGFTLAQRLPQQSKLIEADLTRCQHLANKLPNTTILHGDATEHRLMQQEAIEQQDCFLSLTHDDEDNILAAIQAKHLGCQQVAALIRRMNYTPLLQNSLIDLVLSPDKILLGPILAKTRDPIIKQVIRLQQGENELIHLSAQTMTHCHGQPLDELSNKYGVSCLGVSRNNRWHPYTPALTLDANDQLWIFSSQRFTGL